MNGVFQNCHNIKLINLPKSLNNIGDCTFAGCTKLNTLYIKNNQPKISYTAFMGLTNLRTLNVGNQFSSDLNLMCSPNINRNIMSNTLKRLNDKRKLCLFSNNSMTMINQNITQMAVQKNTFLSLNEYNEYIKPNNYVVGNWVIYGGPVTTYSIIDYTGLKTTKIGKTGYINWASIPSQFNNTTIYPTPNILQGGYNIVIDCDNTIMPNACAYNLRYTCGEIRFCNVNHVNSWDKYTFSYLDSNSSSSSYLNLYNFHNITVINNTPYGKMHVGGSLPPNITHIGVNGLKNCNFHTYVSVPNNLQSVETNGCYGAKFNGNVPDSLTFINNNAFYSSTISGTVNFQKFSNVITAINGFRYSNVTHVIASPLMNNIANSNTQYTLWNGYSNCKYLDLTPVISFNNLYRGLYMMTNLKHLKIANFNSSANTKLMLFNCNNLTTIEAYNVSPYINEFPCFCFGSYSLNVFNNNSRQNLTDIHIRNTNILNASHAFYNAIYIKNITLDNLSNCTSTLNAFINCKNLTRVNLIGIKYISKNTFANCYNLQSLSLTNSEMNYIGDNAFYNCRNLTNFTLPNTISTLNKSCFYGCKSLSITNLPNGLTTIGTNAFAFCSNITSLNCPDTLTSINNCAFLHCTNLKSINLGNSINIIKDDAFCNTQLTYVKIPENCTIGNRSFPTNCIIERGV